MYRRHRKRQGGGADDSSANSSTRRRNTILLCPRHFPAVRSCGLHLALAKAPRHHRKRHIHKRCRSSIIPLHLLTLRPFSLYLLAASALRRRRRKPPSVGMGNCVTRVLGKSSSHGCKAPPADRAQQQDLRELFTPLTNEEESEVNNILYVSYHSKKIIVKHGPSNIEITKEKIQCLGTCAWLNDEVINLYLELLKERAEREPKRFLKCHFFNSFFYKKLACGKTGYDYQSVRRWTALNRLGYGLVECEKIFVPVHRNKHWCLAIINIKDRTFQYLDSLGGVDHAVLRILARYIMDELKDKSNIQVDTSSWPTISDSLPLQQNGNIWNTLGSERQRRY
ncbi:hypothetical protein E2562_031801 [Oryza meyeriana var. granulata]|uniref:Ubiquitin-like protease family profile domain-containing protein n=1 Tax=Oryza meyeriana var. granulata TaxID=110450 RepID=A0A6G1EC42_9ORYZ|nr:hypothetical protein E2562_031801 [Oryza meyeriana var. granulata]